MTLDELKLVAKFIAPVWVDRNGTLIAVADLYREWMPDTSNRWYVWEYDSKLVKLIAS